MSKDPKEENKVTFEKEDLVPIIGFYNYIKKQKGERKTRKRIYLLGLQFLYAYGILIAQKYIPEGCYNSQNEWREVLDVNPAFTRNRNLLKEIGFPKCKNPEEKEREGLYQNRA